MMRTVISIILVFVFVVNQASSVVVRGHGAIGFFVEDTNQVVYMETTLIVPPVQTNIGTIFLWPGLQPGGVNYYPVDNGVLQPVLTWGSSCVPGNQPTPYSTWWISGAYVNTYTNLTGYSGCLGGDIMAVNPGNRLWIHFILNGTVWTQTITNLATSTAVSYSIDMLGQAQNDILFFIELYNTATFVNEVDYVNSHWQFAQPSNTGCTLLFRGINDTVSTPQLSADKLSCGVAKITQRSQ